ncbi:GntR family transcriptional regulator [uncultured Fusobacterium sp.]|uniref:GntR family transcriptional regulator n=1 Tax=uncultured Fusobacterium sp. TaxID=159267 RepID=UPI002625CC6E|nr:GntR family transcriptional regulator [uncultured Fusobacterium sp.]
MISKYEIIKRDIIREIEQGFFKAGDKIYSENDLKDKYSVSNTTVVKALNDLVNEGILIRRQGKGTYVRRNLLHKKVLFSEFAPKERDLQKVEERTITKISTPYKDKEISIKLGSKNGKEKIIHIEQLAFIDNVLWKIDNKYVLCSKLSKEAITKLENGGSLSKELNLSEHMSSLPVKMKINYMMLKKENKVFEIIQKNNCNLQKIEQIPAVVLEKINYDLNGEIIAYIQSYIDPNYYEIEIEI